MLMFVWLFVLPGWAGQSVCKPVWCETSALPTTLEHVLKRGKLRKILYLSTLKSF